MLTNVWLLDIADAVYWWDLEMTSITTKVTKWRAASGNHVVNSQTKLSLITEKFVLWEKLIGENFNSLHNIHWFWLMLSVKMANASSTKGIRH